MTDSVSADTNICHAIPKYVTHHTNPISSVILTALIIHILKLGNIKEIWIVYNAEMLTCFSMC